MRSLQVLDLDRLGSVMSAPKTLCRSTTPYNIIRILAKSYPSTLKKKCCFICWKKKRNIFHKWKYIFDWPQIETCMGLPCTSSSLCLASWKRWHRSVHPLSNEIESGMGLPCTSCNVVSSCLYQYHRSLHPPSTDIETCTGVPCTSSSLCLASWNGDTDQSTHLVMKSNRAWVSLARAVMWCLVACTRIIIIGRYTRPVLKLKHAWVSRARALVCLLTERSILRDN
jgi:hypothetical protein